MFQSIKGWLFLIFGFYLCGVLTVLPLSFEYQWYRPQWFLMFVIFCQLQFVTLFNPLTAWGMGLLVDTLLGVPLGENALIFSIISYITSLIRQECIRRPLEWQVGKIFLLVCLGQIFILWFHALRGHNPRTLLYWMSSLMSSAAWPLLFFFFRKMMKFLSIIPIRANTIHGR